MEIIDFKKDESRIVAYATKLYNRIIKVPGREDKKRTGVQVLLRQIEIEVPNQIWFSVYSPSEGAKFNSVEKAVRSEAKGDFSSQNSEDPDYGKYSGSVTIRHMGRKYQASVSGLKAPEDVFIAVKLLVFALHLDLDYVLGNIRSNMGKLPEEFFDEKHYLHTMLCLRW